MMFLLRTAFWLTIVFALLPGHPKTGTEAAGTTAAAGAAVTATGIDPVEALGAASAAVSDASGFCGRQPQACAIGAEVIAAIGARAEAGARMALAYVGTQIAEEKRKVAERAQGRPSTDTLTADDLGPTWQGQPPVSASPMAVGREMQRILVPLPPKRPASA